LKVLKRNVLESRDAVLAEARAAAKLNHPHVCTIYAVDEIDGLPVIVMEYLDGRPLSQLADEGLQRDVAVDFSRQIAEGLAAAHQQGVIHGDLKPANVIATNQGKVKILDFGLARSRQPPTTPLAEASADSPQRGEPNGSPSSAIDETIAIGAGLMPGAAEQVPNRRRAIQGTPAYMSPEQAGGLRTTPASDVYSLGLMLFEMLTGRRANDESSLVKMILKVQSGELASEVAPLIDEAYRALLTAMLARNAAERPGAGAVAGSLAAGGRYVASS
jgi:serine/threonine protein kinase